MDVNQTIKDAEDALTVRRVFGEPYQHDDITIIPVARVAGAAGGGEGADGRGEGGGSGFGISASPVGVYVIRGDQVEWRPTVDVNRIVLGAVAVSLMALLAGRAAIKARAAAARSRRRQDRGH